MPPDIDTDSPKWTPVDEAARITGKSDRTLRRWVASGKLPHKRDAGRLYVDLAAPALTSPDSDIDTDLAHDIANLRQQLATMTAELDQARRTIADLVNERDYLRQALMMSLASNQKLIDAPARRGWRWPWSKIED